MRPRENDLSSEFGKLQHNVRHLLVVDKSNTNKPIGIITPLDFTRYQEYPNIDDKKDTIDKILEYYI
jgi:hypothetical protein